MPTKSTRLNAGVLGGANAPLVAGEVKGGGISVPPRR